MPYTAPTLLQARTALAVRLQDPLMVRWVAAELDGYLREALRTWNAWTAHWRDQGSFATQGPAPFPVPFYDLAIELPTLRARTITNWELIADLQYALLEPAAPGGTWTGTDQFDLARLTDAINDRRAEFLRETGATITYTEGVAGAPPANGRFDLDESALIVRRATWTPTATGTLLPLTRSDEWAADHFQPAWVAGDADPYAYSTTAVPPITLQVMPPPTTNGRLDLLTITNPAAAAPLVNATLDIPDDWVWVIKWGALADLLANDGLSLDPARSQYCEQRWQQGIEMAAKAPVVLTARIDDVVVPINSLADFDSYQPLWQLVPGAPTEVATAGLNLFSVVPPAGSNLFTVTLDVVRNAPVPVADGDILQVSADFYDAILDYAQHIALFKEGAGQLSLAQSLLERAVEAAGVEMNLQQASQPSRRPILRQQRQDEQAKRRVEEAVPAE